MARYLYGATDEKYPKFLKYYSTEQQKKDNPLSSYKFTRFPLIEGKEKLNKNDVSIVFKATPDTLLNLCIMVIDKMPLVPTYTWSTDRVCQFIRELGYPQYQNTFRENLITGQRLLLVNADALSAMNVKNFDHIKHIAYHIRKLFYFEMTNFARSISLPKEFYYELYKLFRVKSGTVYADTKRSDLWRRMQLIRPKSKNLNHWEILTKWLAMERDPEFDELFGGTRRFKLFKCGPPPPPVPPKPCINVRCTCIPPCTCHWTDKELRKPWRLDCLRHIIVPKICTICCTKCLPPCTCHWTPKMYGSSLVLSCLKDAFPQRYGSAARHAAHSKKGLFYGSSKISLQSPSKMMLTK